MVEINPQGNADILCGKKGVIPELVYWIEKENNEINWNLILPMMWYEIFFAYRNCFPVK